LANNGFEVELIEASPKLGGRAYSFFDAGFNHELDNGQHLLMGCYRFTLNFLKLIGAYKNLFIQKNLSVNFVNNKAEHFQLASPSVPYPFNLLSALFNFKAVTAAERFLIVKFFCRLPFIRSKGIKNLSVKEWLSLEGQSENVISSFWNLIAVSALNTSIDKASAAIFCNILREIFLKGNFHTLMIFPEGGLSKVYCGDAANFIMQKGGNIKISEKIIDLKIENNCVTEIITNKRIITAFDFVVSSVPIYALERFLPRMNEYLNNVPKLNYSSILSVHIKIKNNQLNKKYYGFISSPVHWVFNHGGYITIVISDADIFMNLDKTDIFNMVKKEIYNYLNIEESVLGEYKIIKEKRATFIPSEDIVDNRPVFKTKIDNFFLAGDWTDTSLPSTIESAAKSGRKISDYLITVLS
jgi:squalene-associated FAD-dependent desaturase